MPFIRILQTYKTFIPLQRQMPLAPLILELGTQVLLSLLKLPSQPRNQFYRASKECCGCRPVITCWASVCPGLGYNGSLSLGSHLCQQDREWA